jgi:hypothetical protein
MLGLSLLALAAVTASRADDARRPLAYAPAPVDNPLKGLVPYQGDVRDRFPHSMEFNYLPYAALVKGYDEFDWRPLERMLDDIASRGHQTVFRIFLEYPNKSGVIPDFLVKDGLKVTRWPFQEFPDKPAAMLETPDYSDAKLRRSLKNFIAALGKRYDGDPRIGFITAGLLGTWGEWHNWPRNDLFASKRVQEEVLDAYESAFQITPILLRYPAGPNDATKAPTAHRKFGYHDDSFAWATLHTGKKGDEWFFMTALKAAGPEAETRWKTHPIGGEIRPEAWGRVFDPDPGNPRIQNFRRCVEATHVTWLMDSGMFRKKQSPERIQRAMEEVRRMGYEFHCPAVTIRSLDRSRLELKLEIENRGVAPFYYDWRPEFGLLIDGKPIKTFPGSGRLTGLLPGDKPRIWCDVLDLKDVPAGRYVVAVRVPNPMKGGKPLRFANAAQDIDSPGWLTLGQMEVN